MAEAEAVGRQCHFIRQNRPSCVARRPVSHCETTRFAWPHGWWPVPGRLSAWAVRPNCVIMQPPATSRFSAHRPRPPPGAWHVGPRPWVSCCGCTMPNALYGMATDGLRGSETVVSVFAFGFAATSLLTVQPCCRLASAGHAGPYAEAATCVRVKACAFAFVENALSDGASAAARSLRQPAGRFLPTCRRPLRAMPPCGRRSASVCCCCCRCCPLPSCTLP